MAVWVPTAFHRDIFVAGGVEPGKLQVRVRAYAPHKRQSISNHQPANHFH